MCVRARVRASRLPISKSDTTTHPIASVCTIVPRASAPAPAPASWARIEMMQRDNWKVALQWRRTKRLQTAVYRASDKEINSNSVNCGSVKHSSLIRNNCQKLTIISLKCRGNYSATSNMKLMGCYIWYSEEGLDVCTGYMVRSSLQLIAEEVAVRREDRLLKNRTVYPPCYTPTRFTCVLWIFPVLTNPYRL